MRRNGSCERLRKLRRILVRRPIALGPQPLDGTNDTETTLHIVEMKTNRTFAVVCGVAALVLLCQPPGLAQSGDALYTFQSIQSLVAHHDNRVSLRVRRDGRVEMRFPVYTPQAGQYEWRASPAELDELEQLFAPFMQTDQAALERERATSARAEGELVTVADADLMRFSARLPDREYVHFVTESPGAWDLAVPGSRRIAGLAEAEREVIEWMRRKVHREER